MISKTSAHPPLHTAYNVFNLSFIFFFIRQIACISVHLSGFHITSVPKAHRKEAVIAFLDFLMTTKIRLKQTFPTFGHSLSAFQPPHNLFNWLEWRNKKRTWKVGNICHELTTLLPTLSFLEVSLESKGWLPLCCSAYS